MLRMLNRLRRNERGNVLLLTAAAMPFLLGSAGLAVDTIQWALWKRDLQRAADSAAIAGVYERMRTDTEAAVEAAVDQDLERTGNTPMDLLSDPQVSLEAEDAANDLVDQVQVTLEVQRPLTFSSIFMAEAPIIRATARAASIPGTDDYCLVALETQASKTGVTIGGNAKLDMDCGIISNSPSENKSLINNGSASSVIATVVAGVGGVEKSSNWTVDKYDPYTEAAEDPYADINVDRTNLAGNKCYNYRDSRNRQFFPVLDTTTNLNGNNSITTLAAARTASGDANLSCFRGLNVASGQTMTLPSGTYYIGEAGMEVQGTLRCDSCTFVLTRLNTSAAVGTIRINADGLLDVSAPTTDGHPFKGIAVFQDRNATDNTNANRINGNSTSFVEGAIYLPKQEITFNGGGTNAAVCSRLVARRIIITGNARQTLTQKINREGSCPDYFEDDPIGGGRRVRLVA